MLFSYCNRKRRVVAYPEQVVIGSEKSCLCLRKRKRIVALQTNCMQEFKRSSVRTKTGQYGGTWGHEESLCGGEIALLCSVAVGRVMIPSVRWGQCCWTRTKRVKAVSRPGTSQRATCVSTALQRLKSGSGSGLGSAAIRSGAL